MSDHNLEPHTVPSLQLADDVSIHCGPENHLLRHMVASLFASFLTDAPFAPTWMPLLLYGKSLCGKSVVAHGLANAWKQHYPDEPIAMLTALDLARNLQKTALSDDIDRMTRQLRRASLVVIDDIQELAGRESADAWFTTLLDYRLRNHKPIIVTCNSTATSCQLSARLKSRLSSGLSVCISLPYAATRKEVILRSARSFDLDLIDADVDELVKLTSGRPVSGIRSLIASVALRKDASEVDDEIQPAALAQKLIRTTAQRFGLRVTDLKGPSRRKNMVLARAVAMFLIRTVTPLSLTATGQLFRNRDHTTVRHACEKIRNQVVHDETIQDAVLSICSAVDVQLPPSCTELMGGKCA